MISCGEAIVRALEQCGVEVVFGVPGVHTLEYYRGLASTAVRPVLARHEQGAAFMADGYARATGRVGVCCVITGPGLTNAATGIAQAQSDSIPVLVITSVNRGDRLGRGWGDLHETRDQLAIVRPFVRRAEHVASASDAGSVVAELLAETQASRPGPCVLQVPIDVLEERVAQIPVPASKPPPHEPDHAAVEVAAALLRQAEAPCLVLGGGAIEASSEMTEIAERTGAPVLTTIAGKGVVDDAHSLAVGAALSRPKVQRWLEQRDVVVAVGTELAETDTLIDQLDISGKLIRVDVDADRFSDPHGADVPVRGDARLFGRRLLAALEASTPSPSAAVRARTEADALRRSLARGHTELERRHVRLLELLREALPSDGRVYADMTQIAYTGNHTFRVDRPRRWLHPVGYGTLGYAVPAAIGGLVGDPATPTVALVGDGGFLYTLQELATAAELGAALAVVIWNNEALGQIRDDMVERDITPTSVMPANPDFGALAAAFGFHTARPSGLDEVGDALATAIAHNAPALVELNEAQLFGAWTS